MFLRTSLLSSLSTVLVASSVVSASTPWQQDSNPVCEVVTITRTGRGFWHPDGGFSQPTSVASWVDWQEPGKTWKTSSKDIKTATWDDWQTTTKKIVKATTSKSWQDPDNWSDWKTTTKKTSTSDPSWGEWSTASASPIKSHANSYTWTRPTTSSHPSYWNTTAIRTTNSRTTLPTTIRPSTILTTRTSSATTTTSSTLTTTTTSTTLSTTLPVTIITLPATTSTTITTTTVTTSTTSSSTITLPPTTTTTSTATTTTTVITTTTQPACPVQDSTELIFDPSFNCPALERFWSFAQFSVSSTEGHDDSYSAVAQLNSDSTTYSHMSQSVAYLSGATYSLSLWYKFTVPDACRVAVATINSRIFTFLTPSDDQWTQYSTTFQAGSDDFGFLVTVTCFEQSDLDQNPQFAFDEVYLNFVSLPAATTTTTQAATTTTSTETETIT